MIVVSRRMSFLLAGGLLIGFFSIALFLTVDRHSNSGAARTPPVASGALDQSASGSVVLTNFHRSQTRPNGEKEWEITAEKGEYTPGASSITITNGNLTIFQEKGSKIQITSPVATIELIDTTMKVVTCSGGVTIEYDGDMRLRTASLTYWKESGKIEALSRVTIENHSGETSGDSLKGDAISRRFELLGNVSSLFRNKPQD